MPRSNEERLRLLRQLDQRQFLEQRRNRLYNKKYRKGLLFISCWTVRLLYIILLLVVSFIHRTPNGNRKEVVVDRYVDRYISRSKSGSRIVTNLYITTNKSNYQSNFGDQYPPNFNVGDTLIIEQNIFHKAIYFSKTEWRLKYWISLNYRYYYIVLFFTIISFFFNDGLDRFTNKLLSIIMATNLIAMACYLLA
jgi:hypothetical protein